MSNDIVNNKAQGQNNSVADFATGVFEGSSVCAVSTILSTDNKPRKVFRSAVFALFTVACLYQSIGFLYYIFQYPTIIDQEIIRPEAFDSPAFTFCNFNPAKRSKFCEKYPSNCTKPSKRFCDENPRFCGTPDTQILKDDISDVDTAEELYDLNHEAEDMFGIPGDDELIPSGPLPRTKQSERGKAACFSIYDRVNSPLDSIKKKRTPLATGYTDSFVFDPQENELIYLEAKSGILFDVHSPFEPSNPFDTGFLMNPGHLYRVRVKMTQEEFLPNECLNYTEIWLKNNKTGYRSQAACRQKCLGDMMVKCFNCFDSFVLYPYPDVKFCNFSSKPPEPLEGCKSPEDEAYDCVTMCKDDCLKTKFSYEVKELFLNSYALAFEKNESRVIKVLVEFPDVNIPKIVHKPQFQVLEIFSLIGGILAFWIGLSMVQIVEVFDCLLQIVKQLFRNRSRASENSSA